MLVGATLLAGLDLAMDWTNTLGFCISCHEMRDTVYEEYRTSVHYANASGVRAVCADCHVPRAWLPKVARKIEATRELYYWAIGSIDTPAKFEARRLTLARRVWDTLERTGSRECRNCHRFEDMDLPAQGRFARRIHEDAIERGAPCMECHRALVHRLPDLATVTAEPAPISDADLEYGEEINQICAGCHGEFGEGTTDGEYPRLAGLDARYLASALRQFKSRERINIPMTPYATERELPEEDIRAVSAYLASIALPSRLEPLDEKDAGGAGFDALGRLEASARVVNIARHPGNAEAGGRLYARECAGCHGEAGQGQAKGNVPPLAGQYTRYLWRQLRAFRAGDRRHDDERDAAIFRAFSDAELDDVLAWLSLVDDG